MLAAGVLLSLPGPAWAGNGSGDDSKRSSQPIASSNDEVTAGVGLDRGSVTVIRVDVLSLERRRGDVVDLRFRLVNEGDATFEFSDRMGEGNGNFDVSGVELVDLPNDRKYLTLQDEDDECLCSELTSSVEEIERGERSPVFRAQFTAPPNSVKQIDVAVPEMPVVTGVPIS
jgi:hypothetical protein